MNKWMDHIDYPVLMDAAMRSVIRAVLTLAKDGLPGEHHFFITINPNLADIPDWLKEKYPEELVIALQHQFRDLKVREDGFEVELSFDYKLAHLRIPYDAIIGFVDPSVEFGMDFVKPKETKRKKGAFCCSFCGKSNRDVKRLIAKSSFLAICNECVELCTEALGKAS